MQVTFYFAGESTQVLDALPWVRCASGNVWKWFLYVKGWSQPWEGDQKSAPRQRQMVQLLKLEMIDCRWQVRPVADNWTDWLSKLSLMHFAPFIRLLVIAWEKTFGLGPKWLWHLFWWNWIDQIEPWPKVANHHSFSFALAFQSFSPADSLSSGFYSSISLDRIRGTLTAFLKSYLLMYHEMPRVE